MVAIVPKKSSTPSAAPTAGVLATGEIACNAADGTLYLKDSGGNVVTLADKATTAKLLGTLLIGTNGGTGVNNSTRTITYAGNVAFTGAYNVSFTVPGAYTYTLPSLTSILATEQLQQLSKSADYTFVLGDANKHVYHPATDNNPRTFTIPSNGSVSYPVGTALTFVNLVNSVTIAINSDILYFSPSGATGSRTLAAYGIATALKVASTTWLISGSGLS